MPPTYSLTRRQQRLYTDTVDIFAVRGGGKHVNIATGEPDPVRIECVARDVPCKLVYTANVDDVTVVGRIKRFNLDTADFLHLPAGVRIENEWWVANTTRRPDGSRHEQFGQVSKVMGAPTIVPGVERRPANVQILQIEEHEQPPAEITAALALRETELFGPPHWRQE